MVGSDRERMRQLWTLAEGESVYLRYSLDA
jgi:hypothetical protein